MRTKTWSGAKHAKMTWSHLFTPVHGFENRVFYLVLGPGQRSLTAGGKKEPILDCDFYENMLVKTEC